MTESTDRENLDKVESKAEEIPKLTTGQKEYLKVKRIIDVILSGGAIIVLSPANPYDSSLSGVIDKVYTRDIYWCD